MALNPSNSSNLEKLALKGLMQLFYRCWRLNIWKTFVCYKNLLS